MKNILIFLAGGAVGAVVSAKLVEKYYRDLADEEIESVVEHFKNKEKELKEKTEDKVENKTETKPKKNKKKDKVEDIVKTEEYIPNEEEEEVVERPVDSIVGFEIIDPMNFGEEDEYDTKSWTHWADGVLTNELDEIIETPEEFIGDALSHFGDYEEDSVYVRNHASKTDYEILKSEKEFNA